MDYREYNMCGVEEISSHNCVHVIVFTNDNLCTYVKETEKVNICDMKTPKSSLRMNKITLYNT